MATINGTPNGDFLEGTNQADTISGLAGNDRILGGRGNDTINGDAGDDVLFGEQGNDILNTGTSVSFDVIFGGAGNDTLTVNPGAVGLLSGGEGNDTLIGNAAAGDALVGRAGNDSLTGGAGGDFFGFASGGQPFTRASYGIDTITDFSAAEDLIYLDGGAFSAFTNLAQFATVTSDTAARTSPGILVYNTVNGHLFYNPNGTAGGFGSGGQFAVVQGLTAGNILLVNPSQLRSPIANFIVNDTAP